MYIGLVIMSDFWLHIPYILSIFINSLISGSHINFICSHLISILLSDYLRLGYGLLISWWWNSNWYWNSLVMLFFILFTFLVWVKMKMYIVWIIVFIIFIVTIIVWSSSSAWEITSWVIIW